MLAAPPRTGRWAAIVDQLALTAPGPAFNESATETLNDGGYNVDYVPGDSVGVDFYRSLGQQDYKVIVFRVHAGRLRLKGEQDVKEDAGLFTSQRYVRDEYKSEQLDRRLFIARYLDGTEAGQPSYFGIAPDFIRKSMKGDLHGATIILMGCDGVRGEELAAAFRERGAGAVIGWDELVTSERTDLATARLLQHLVRDGLAPQAAVNVTMAEIGPDDEYGSTMMVYGSQASAQPH